MNLLCHVATMIVMIKDVKGFIDTWQGSSNIYQPAMKKKRDKIIEKVGFFAKKRDIPKNFDKMAKITKLIG